MLFPPADTITISKVEHLRYAALFHLINIAVMTYRIQTYLVFVFLILGSLSCLQAQVTSYGGKTRAGGFRLVKDVPSRTPPQVSGEGAPTMLYVVQLARFEDMPSIPAQFPKGTLVWVNPDHANEKLLLAGFYTSLEEAEAAAVKWRRNPTFAKAFVREQPFLVRYD